MVGKSAIALALLAGVVVAGCGGKDKKQPEQASLNGTVQIGVLAPTERVGELGVRGKDLTDGAQLAADEINRNGGVLGHKLELQVVDDACSFAKGVRGFSETEVRAFLKRVSEEFVSVRAREQELELRALARREPRR